LAYILSIETATNVCSVALLHNGTLLALREDSSRNSHSAYITIFVDEVVKEAGLTLQQLDAVAVGKGPGSYTGLRIGVSAAKGLCYALDKPLIGINTLEGMANHPAVLPYRNNTTLLCPMIDARRMEVYCALFNHNGQWVQQTQALIIDADTFAHHLQNNTVVFFGDGAAKCKEVINHPNAVFIDGISPSANSVGILAFEAYKNNSFEDVAYFEPFYLKEFVGTLPRGVQ
jgi:tRNA threonylcarbamoyladenosine biosynthesis protein TsaB